MNESLFHFETTIHFRREVNHRRSLHFLVILVNYQKNGQGLCNKFLLLLLMALFLSDHFKSLKEQGRDK